MKKLFTFFGFLFCLQTISAQNIQLTNGGSTTSSQENSTTSANPISQYFEYMRFQVVYTAAEINAAGITGTKTITQMGWYIVTSPNDPLPNYTIRMANTTATNSASHNASTLTQVYTNAIYAPVAGGFNLLNLNGSFVWDGVSNILVDVCFGAAIFDEPYGDIRIYAPTTTNGSRRIRDDGSGSLCGENTELINDFKPQISFTFAPPPSCFAPSTLINSAVTSGTASHAWTAPSPTPSNGYEWAVTTSATAPTTGTATTSLNANSTGLLANTTYYLHVRSNCGASFSTWTTSATFTTLCSADNVPYVMPITGVTVPALPSCTKIENIGNLPNTWISATSSNPDLLAQFTMPVMAYVYDFSNPANDWLFTNGINLSAGTSYTLKFKYSNDLGTLYPEAMNVAYGTSSTAAGMTNTLANYPVISGPTATNASIIFTPPTTGVYYIGFHAVSTANQNVLLLDDVEVILTPSCVPVSGLAVTSSITNAALSWNAVLSAANGYEYIVDQVATSPTVAGTGTTSTSVSVGGTYTIGATYYAHVRAICSGTDFSTWTNLAFVIPPNCTTNLTPVNGATSQSNPIPISWNASTGATSYNIFLSSDAGATYTNVGNVTGTSANLSVVNPGTYSWYVQPTNVSPALGCVTSAFTFTTAAPPVNDICTNAISLNVSNGFCGSPITGTIAFADSTTGLGTASCASSALRNDVWYKVVVPNTGKVTVQTSAVGTAVTDLVIQAYSGACNSLILLGCDDDGNPDLFPSSGHSKLGLEGRTPGEEIYFRVMPYGTISNAGPFAICAFDTSASVTPAISFGSPNACTNAVTLIVDSAYKYTWATFKDASGNVIAQVYPNGNKLGSTAGAFYKNSGAVRIGGSYYLDRNISLTPTTQPTSGNVLTRLFYTSAELTALQAVDPTVTNSNLNVNKTATTCSPTFASNAPVFIAQSSNGSYSADRYIDVNVANFSEFFLKGGAGVLPVAVEFIKGSKLSNGNLIDWKVNCTSAPSIVIELERSADARRFEMIKTEAATAVRCLQAFNHVDAQPLAGMNYYRLKITEPSGAFKYSSIVAILNKDKGFEIASLAPNPVKDVATISLASAKASKVEIAIADVAGRILVKQANTVIAGNNNINMNFAQLAAGTYTVIATNAEGEVKSMRFVKY
jgi:hypothetical protein